MKLSTVFNMLNGMIIGFVNQEAFGFATTKWWIVSALMVAIHTTHSLLYSQGK